MEPLTGYLMSADRQIARIERGEIIWAEEALLPLYLKRTQNVESWLAGRAIDDHRVNSRLLKKALRLRSADDAETALAVNGATITDTYWICRKDQPLRYEEVRFCENYFDTLALRGDPDGFSRKPSRTPELTNIGSYEKCWRLRDGIWWMYKAGNMEEYFSELFICRLGMEMGFSMAWYEMDGEYIRTRDFTEGAKVNFETFDGITGEDDDYSRCFRALRGLGAGQMEEAYLKLVWLDTLCFNMDRHTKNFGLLRDRNSGRILTLAPNYDNNIALVSRGYSRDISRGSDGLIGFFRAFIEEEPEAKRQLQALLASGGIPQVTAAAVSAVLSETERELPGSGVDQDYVRDFVLNGQRRMLELLA